MVSKRPSIYIYANKADPDILGEICAGIEEEGIFFEIKEQEQHSLALLAYQAAADSMLGSGIGITKQEVAFQLKGLNEGTYIVYHNNPEKTQSRYLGMNAARAVKKQPFKE